MKKERLLKEKQSLMDWLEKIVENNPEEIEDPGMRKYVEKQIDDVDKKLREEN